MGRKLCNPNYFLFKGFKRKSLRMSKRGAREKFEIVEFSFKLSRSQNISGRVIFLSSTCAFGQRHPLCCFFPPFNDKMDYPLRLPLSHFQNIMSFVFHAFGGGGGCESMYNNINRLERRMLFIKDPRVQSKKNCLLFVLGFAFLKKEWERMRYELP